MTDGFELSHSFTTTYSAIMKQLIICLALASTLTSAENEHEGYAPYFAHGAPNIIDLGEHLDPKQEFKVEHPAGLIFGHGFLDGLHKIDGHSNLEGFKHGSLEYIANVNLIGSFDKQLVAPEVPKPIATFGQQYSPKYTNTPTSTYEVMEDNFEPKPVPKLSVATPVLPSQNFNLQSVGSGSLGVSDLGGGNYALGSGSLGYVGGGAEGVSAEGGHDFSSSILNSGEDGHSFGSLQGGFSGDSGDSGFKPGGGIAEFSSYFKQR